MGAQITGLKETNERLLQLDEKVRGSIVKKALRAGATITKDEIGRTAPRKSGKLASSYMVTRGSVTKKGRATVKVQVAKKFFKEVKEDDSIPPPSNGKPKKAFKFFYAGFLNFGYRSGSVLLPDRSGKVM